MAWLVSFLNVGPRVASPNDNFLLFGANCKEDHKVVELFTSKLVKDIAVIEQKNYAVLEKQVKFTFQLVFSMASSIMLPHIFQVLLMFAVLIALC
jgi:hypothetical protein